MTRSATVPQARSAPLPAKGVHVRAARPRAAVVSPFALRLRCALVALGLSGCRSAHTGSDAQPSANGEAAQPSGDPVDARAAGGRCVVFLHGKSGRGAPSEVRTGFVFLAPTGNADGWGGKQWLYFPDAQYAEVRAIVASAIERSACERVLVHGFSNGGAAAAALYCRGETFGGRVVSFVFDDPVPDHAADACAPPASAKAALYWTGALSQATPGWSCAEGDWTCQGGSTVGVARYAQNLGVPVTQSAETSHTPYASPPEYAAF